MEPDEININNKSCIYFDSLKIKNVRCFKKETNISFLNGKNNIAQWTILLGNNNTGKTTILEALASLNPVVAKMQIKEKEKTKEIKNLCIPKGFISDNKYFSDVKGFENNSYVGANIFKLKNENIHDNIFDIKNNELRKLNDPYFNNIIFKTNNKKNNDKEKIAMSNIWGYSPNGYTTPVEFKYIGNLEIYCYGVHRRIGNSYLSESKQRNNNNTLIDFNIELINVEEWILQTDYAIKNNNAKAEKILEKIKELIKSDLFSDIKSFRIKTDKNLKNFVEFETPYGFSRLNNLGYGYQSSIAWIIDLMKKLFDRYPDSENPLCEPAIVLIDEIDLHIHPIWQREIVNYLSKIFPATQFIVSTHSPQIIQTADNINLILLRKNGDRTEIKQIFNSNFKGWTTDEILSELLELGEEIQSDEYLTLMNLFSDALNEFNNKKATEFYNELDKILHPSSPQRKLLRLQLSSIKNYSND